MFLSTVHLYCTVLYPQDLDANGDFKIAVDGLISINTLGMQLNVNFPRVEVSVKLDSVGGGSSPATAGFFGGGVASKLAGATQKLDDASDKLDNLKASLNEKCKCLFGDCPNNVYQNKTLLQQQGVNTNITRKPDGSSCWESTQCVSKVCTDHLCAATDTTGAVTASFNGGGSAANGASCSANHECAGDWCNDGVCATKGTGPEGATCTTNSYCASGVCTWGFTCSAVTASSAGAASHPPPPPVFSYPAGSACISSGQCASGLTCTWSFKCE